MQDFKGRNSQNKMIIFPKVAGNFKPGDYVDGKGHQRSYQSATLKGEVDNATDTTFFNK